MAYDFEVPNEADLLHHDNLPKVRRMRPYDSVRTPVAVAIANRLKPVKEPRPFSGAVQTALWIAPEMIAAEFQKVDRSLIEADRWVQRRRDQYIAAIGRTAIRVQHLHAAKAEVDVAEHRHRSALRHWLYARRRERKAGWAWAPSCERLLRIPRQASRRHHDLIQAKRSSAEAWAQVTSARERIETARGAATTAAVALAAAREKEKEFEERLERARVLLSRAEWNSTHVNTATWSVGRTGRENVLAATIYLPAPVAAKARAAGVFRPDPGRLSSVRLTAVR